MASADWSLNAKEVEIISNVVRGERRFSDNVHQILFPTSQLGTAISVLGAVTSLPASRALDCAETLQL